ncbi:MAG: hypothetical protein IKE91_04700 [Clostridia bacterium]|nr:hypothetical protein [Clostridia bacterium]
MWRFVTKRIVITTIFVGFLISLILFSNNNLIAAKEGLALWANCVVPAVFPFCIAVELLNHTDIAHILGKLLNGIMRPLFNVPGVAGYALIMGLISSSPIGATIAIDLYENKLLTKNEAERLLAFTNNTGPLFIVGTTGILLFGSKLIGYLLLVTHILSSLTVGIILGITSRIKNDNKEVYDNSYYKSVIKRNTDDLNDLGGILSQSIKKSIALVLQIGGFVVLFSVIISILNDSNIFNVIASILEKFYVPKDFTKSLLTGLLELTSGVSFAANLKTTHLSLNVILCSFLLGFCSISVMLQVISIVSKSNLSTKTYIKGKLLHGATAMLYTAILINYMPIFQLDIKPYTINFNITKIALIIITFIVAFATILIKSELHHKLSRKQYN